MKKMQYLCIVRQEHAEEIKCKIVDYMLAKHPNIIIGNEIMYGTSRKVADLICVLDNQTIVIEIKSDSDNIYRLSGQLNEYSKVFDKIIVVTTLSQQKKVEKILPFNVGLIIIRGEALTEVRAPKAIKKHSKREILYSITSCFLKDHFRLNHKLRSDDVRKFLGKEKISILHDALIKYITLKIQRSFSSFMDDRGRISNSDDIPTLSSGDVIF